MPETYLNPMNGLVQAAVWKHDCRIVGTVLFSFSLFTGAGPIEGQNISIDITGVGRRQTIEGFGTCLSGSVGQQAWWKTLYFEDLQCSVLRMDLTPRFKAPYSGVNGTYNSPWYHNNPALPGPDNNNVRTYTNAASYLRSYNGWSAPIAVMGPDIDRNANYFDFNYGSIPIGAALARLGENKKGELGDFRLIGSLWSPAPWLKIASGNNCPNWGATPMPVRGTPWPFIWFDNFAGGKLDTSGSPVPEFDDSAMGGTGPTSALTQFARCTAAWLRGFQNTYGVRFYAISIQNELNFEEFYGSCTYPLSAEYLLALRAVRSELNKYPDLAPIQIMGPEDLLGGDAWGLWQYGGGNSSVHKNLQYLQNLAADAPAAASLAFFCIHGYASDGVSAPNATPTLWDWWANGWTASPVPGIPPNVKGFLGYGKKSWMTETSGESADWLSPANGYPNTGAWSIALRLHQALTSGQQSAWVYWQMADGNPVGASTLTDASLLANSPKYVAAKHFIRCIRPGAVRLESIVNGASNLLVSAYLHETNRTLTVVLLNTSASNISATVNWPNEMVPARAIRAYSSSNGSYWQRTDLAFDSKGVWITVPGYGVVTLYGVAQPVLEATVTQAGKMTLNWRQAALGFELQFSPSLEPPVHWETLSNLAVISNGLASAATNLDSTSGFYRLILR